MLDGGIALDIVNLQYMHDLVNRMYISVLMASDYLIRNKRKTK